MKDAELEIAKAQESPYFCQTPSTIISLQSVRGARCGFKF
jgi:hypothetical protein